VAERAALMGAKK